MQSSRSRSRLDNGKSIVASSRARVKKPKQKKDSRKEMEARIKSFLGIKLIKERGINLAKLGHTNIPEKVNTLGWVQFVSQPIDINKSWVAEFYAVASPDEFEQGVPIRGRRVLITSSRINEFLGIQDLNIINHWDFGFYFHQDLTFGVPEDFVAELREFPIGEWDERNSSLDHRELSTELAFWNIFQRHSLLPVPKNQALTYWELKTLKCINRGARFNVGRVICSRLEDSLRIPKPSRLIFPSLITHFCQMAGVPAYDNDEIEAAGTLMSRWEWSQVASKRTIPPPAGQEEEAETAEQPEAGQQRRRRRDEPALIGPSPAHAYLGEDQMARILGAIASSELSLRQHMDDRFRQQQESISSLEAQIRAMQAFFPGFPPPPPPQAEDAVSDQQGTEILPGTDIDDA